MKALSVAIAVFTALTVLWSPRAAASVVNLVELRSEASYGTPDITLSDIAVISGPDAGAMGRIVVAHAPSDASGIVVTAKTVEQRIRKHFLGPFVLDGASSVHAVASGDRACREALVSLFTDEVMRRSPWKDRGVYEVYDVKVVSSARTFPADMTGVQAHFSPREDFLGDIRATLVASDRPGAPRAVVTGRSILKAQVPVPRRAVPRGSLVTADDLGTALVDITHDPGVFWQASDLVGMRARVRLGPGSAVRLAQVERRPEVCSGGEVTLRVQASNLTVEARGLAVRDGRVGQSVPVKNIVSGKIVIGTVIADSVVQVEL